MSILEGIGRLESGGKEIGRHGDKSTAYGKWGLTKTTQKALLSKYKDLDEEITNAGYSKTADLPVHLQKRLAERLTEENQAGLKKAGLRGDDPILTYASHFGGLGFAKKIAGANPDEKVGDLLTAEQKKANPQIAELSIKNFFSKISKGFQGINESTQGGLSQLASAPSARSKALAGETASNPYETSTLGKNLGSNIMEGAGNLFASMKGGMGLGLSQYDPRRTVPNAVAIASAPPGAPPGMPPQDPNAIAGQPNMPGAGQPGQPGSPPVNVANIPAGPGALPPAQQKEQLEHITQNKIVQANQKVAQSPGGGQNAGLMQTPGADSVLAGPKKTDFAGWLNRRMTEQPNQMAGNVMRRPGSSVEETQDFARQMAMRHGGGERNRDVMLAGDPSNERRAAAGGMMYGYASGGQTESAPWEDYAQSKQPVASNAGPSGDSGAPPWADYAQAPESASPEGAAKPKSKSATFAKLLATTLPFLGGKEQVSLEDAKKRQAEGKNVAKDNTWGDAAVRTATGVGQGFVVDPVRAGAQIFGGKGGREWASEQGQEYERNRAELGGEGIDLARLAGNVVPVGAPASLVGKGLAKVGAKTVGEGLQTAGKAISPGLAIDQKLASSGSGLFKRGAAQGTLAGATQPIENLAADADLSDALMQKGLQTVGGAGLGGVTNKFIGKQAPSILKRNEDIEKFKLANPDVVPTWGQNAGGWADRLEQKATVVPWLGDTIRESRTRALQEQNVGIMNTALKGAGIKLDKGTTAGRDMFNQAYDKLTGRYDKVLKNASLSDPQSLRAAIYGRVEKGGDAADFNALSKYGKDSIHDDKYIPGVISSKYNQLSEEGQQRFDKYIETGFFKKFGKDPDGNYSLPMSGQKFKGHEEDLKDTIASLAAGGAEDRQIAGMLKSSLGQAYTAFQTKGGKGSEELKKLNKAYAKYKTLETASTASGASEGIFSPTQVVRAATKGSRGQVAKGKGLLQDEAELAGRVLGKPYPDSGTAGRLNASNITQNIIGGALSLPVSLAYNPTVMKYARLGTTGLKDKYLNSRLGSKLAKNAPLGVSGGVRSLFGPSGDELETHKEFAAGGSVANEYLEHKLLQAQLSQMQPPPGMPPGGMPPGGGQPPAGAMPPPMPAQGGLPPQGGMPPQGGLPPPQMARGGRVRSYARGGFAGLSRY